MSSICTSSMKRTPGTISALPSSLHSATFWSIWSLTSGLISPMSPANKAKNPWVLLLITSISWSVTVWTTSFLLCNSPSGHYTNLAEAPTLSKSPCLANDLPSFDTFPLALSIVMMSPGEIFSFQIPSIIFVPRSYIASISVVLSVIFPDLVELWSISISRTSPSMISASSLILTPMDFLNAWVRD